jgi:hypothetical protein
VNVVFLKKKNTQSDGWTRWFIGYYYFLIYCLSQVSLVFAEIHKERERISRKCPFIMRIFLKSFQINAQRKMGRWRERLADNFSDHKFIWKKPARVRFPVFLRSSNSPLTAPTEISIFVRLFSLITTTQMKCGCVHWMSNDDTSHWLTIQIVCNENNQMK